MSKRATDDFVMHTLIVNGVRREPEWTCSGCGQNFPASVTQPHCVRPEPARVFERFDVGEVVHVELPVSGARVYGKVLFQATRDSYIFRRVDVDGLGFGDAMSANVDRMQHTKPKARR